MTQVELESVPTARNPWSIISQTPSVVTDRTNVGGTDDFRTDDVFMTDVRLEKESTPVGSTSFAFSIDGFDIFN